MLTAGAKGRGRLSASPYTTPSAGGLPHGFLENLHELSPRLLSLFLEHGALPKGHLIIPEMGEEGLYHLLLHHDEAGILPRAHKLVEPEFHRSREGGAPHLASATVLLLDEHLSLRTEVDVSISVFMLAVFTMPRIPGVSGISAELAPKDEPRLGGVGLQIVGEGEEEGLAMIPRSIQPLSVDIIGPPAEVAINIGASDMDMMSTTGIHLQLPGITELFHALLVADDASKALVDGALILDSSDSEAGIMGGTETLLKEVSPPSGGTPVGLQLLGDRPVLALLGAFGGGGGGVSVNALRAGGAQVGGLASTVDDRGFGHLNNGKGGVTVHARGGSSGHDIDSFQSGHSVVASFLIRPQDSTAPGECQ